MVSFRVLSHEFSDFLVGFAVMEKGRHLVAIRIIPVAVPTVAPPCFGCSTKRKSPQQAVDGLSPLAEEAAKRVPCRSLPA
jgi:hypothetical protein